MLIAHAVPAYFAIQVTHPHWDKAWTPSQRWLLTGLVLGSTVWPDTDVVYNIVMRGFANHSTL